MQFCVRVVSRRPGMPPVGDEMSIEADAEMPAGEKAKLEARRKYPGCLPVVMGVRAATKSNPWEQKWEAPVPVLEGDEPEAKPADDTPKENAQPKVHSFAELDGMQFFKLRSIAKHASGVVPKSKDEALLMLQERGLVSP